MSPKKWLRSIKERELDLQERLFRLLVVIWVGSLGIVIANGIVAGKSIKIIIPLVIAFALFVCIAVYSIRFHKIQLGATIIGALIVFLIAPFNFLTSGGIYGGASLYLLFGMVYVCLVVEGKMKSIFLVSSFVVCGVCYFVAYSYPSLVLQYTRGIAYINAIMSLVIVGLLICGMILFQNSVFRSENELAKKQKQEIEELNQAQSRFFSSMSHEIRTPINTIIGLNEMILREDISDEVAADAINIQHASNLLLTLINDFLDMSKIESGKMDILAATYDVGAMLSDIVNMVWVRAKEKGLEFHIDVDEAIPVKLIGDEVRIKQILINLLNNAVKYTQTGSVTLSIQRTGRQSDCELISYSVTDTGIGIKRESIPYLFNAFKRVDEENTRYIEGTGLGLSIVKQLVDLMGGSISVNSIYMKGSSFVITLPQKIAGLEKIGNFNLDAKHMHGLRESYKQSFEAPKAHVLIVDDNDTNLMVTAKLLRDTKVQIDTATSGEECLKRTLQNRYDVILMDHLMPVMDGIECMNAVRVQPGGLNHNAQIVILTANADETHQALYRREGANGYLSKPFTGAELEETLLKHLPKEIVSTTKADGSVGVVETPTVAYSKRLSVMISTDSVCDLPQKLVEKYQIAVMPYRVCTDSGEFLDGIEAETDGILTYIADMGKNVKSEAPGVEDYEEFFADQLEKAQYIVHITMAKNVSAGYAHAVEASKTFDNVIVVDSGHLSSGLGLMVLRAVEFAADGLSAEDIAGKLEDIKTWVRTSFIVDSTEFLARSGRIKRNIHEICKSFMLHPVIVLRDSSMKVGSIKIGAKYYTRRKYIASTLKIAGEIDTRTLFITYAGLTQEELEVIEEQVKAKIAFKNIIYQKASPAISSNCGPGTFGLIFMMR